MTIDELIAWAHERKDFPDTDPFRDIARAVLRITVVYQAARARRDAYSTENRTRQSDWDLEAVVDRARNGLYPTDHEPDCPAYGRSDMDARTVLNECTCPMGNQ